MIFSREKLSSLVDSYRGFFKFFHKASKCLKILLVQLKIDIGSKKQKHNLFVHYYKDIKEHPKRGIRLSFRFGNNNSCVFSIKKFEVHGNQSILTEIVNPNHHNIHHLYKNRFDVAN